MMIPLRSTPGIHTPIIVPKIDPIPPNTLVPPRADAAIASSESDWWPPIDVVLKRASESTPPKPDRDPARA